ncbi:hypothetical protein [Nocardia yamanashiensis]|uniref:hypothetical protein n=1 Tax=Nocardia yamanashiensis TaxID=209247 RepID=UPI00082E65EA|nr:hypothetical protein [Nocardia yamanashiensis]
MTVITASATSAAPVVPLRTALRLDGAGTGVFGIFMLAAARALRDPLGLPTAWSIPFGVAMLGGAIALLLIAGYPEIPVRLGYSVVAVNAASAVGLIALTWSGLIDLTGWGIAFLLIGAVFVAVFAALEWAGARALGAI